MKFSLLTLQHASSLNLHRMKEHHQLESTLAVPYRFIFITQRKVLKQCISRAHTRSAGRISQKSAVCLPDGYPLGLRTPGDNMCQVKDRSIISKYTVYQISYIMN